jgi:hypothetical protein
MGIPLQRLSSLQKPRNTISLTKHGGYIPENCHSWTNHGWCTVEHRTSTQLCSHSPKPVLHVLLLNTDQKHSNIKTVQVPWHTGQCYKYKEIQCDSFGTKPKKIQISQRLFNRFWTCIYDYIPCFIRSMSILEEMLEMFATTVHIRMFKI